MIAGEENEGPSSESLGVCAVADGGNGRFGLAHDGDDDELMGSELAEGREAMAHRGPRFTRQLRPESTVSSNLNHGQFHFLGKVFVHDKAPILIPKVSDPGFVGILPNRNSRVSSTNGFDAARSMATMAASSTTSPAEATSAESTWGSGFGGMSVVAAAFAALSVPAVLSGRASVAKQSLGHRLEVLMLYKRILRTCQSWPSVKKAEVAASIRDEFRTNASERDPKRIEKMLAEARSGLQQLSHQAAESARARATLGVRRGDASLQRGDPRLQAHRWALDELGVGAKPTMADLKRAYRERAKTCHPDSGGTAEAFERLTRAWEHAQKHYPRVAKA